MQLVTGIFLTMNYKPSADDAFASVEYIMRDVDWGWLIRYLHSTGASAFFIVVYLHMFRALLYGSYKKPRELVWIIGMFIYLCLMAEAFFGYLLPWGNMSYWGAQVIVSLFGAIPVIGNGLVGVDPRRLLHLRHHAEPLLRVARDRGAARARAARRRAHHGAARSRLEQSRRHRDQEGTRTRTATRSTASRSIRITRSKTSVSVGVFLIAVRRRDLLRARRWAATSSSTRTSSPANALQTPEHIAPVWYFTPFYAILRAVPNKLLGVVLMGSAVLLFVLPAVARPLQGEVDPLPRLALQALRSRSFAISFLALGYLGMQARRRRPYVMLARIFTVLYFAFFLLMPLYSRVDKTKPVPTRVTYHAHAPRRCGARRAPACLGVGGAPRGERGRRSSRRTTTSSNAAVAAARRASNFVNYCLGCHSAKYVRYNRTGGGPRHHRAAARSTT